MLVVQSVHFDIFHFVPEIFKNPLNNIAFFEDQRCAKDSDIEHTAKNSENKKKLFIPQVRENVSENEFTEFLLNLFHETVVN